MPNAAKSCTTARADGSSLDAYPYTFSPLLLFAQDGYFDKGHSNYNSVAQFFASVLPVNMLDNVLYERKNMLYDELLEHVTQRRMLATSGSSRLRSAHRMARIQRDWSSPVAK